MAPWTQHLIESQFEKVTARNFDEIAQRIVGLIDTRSNVQRLALLLVRQANRWYAHSFHRQHDADKRNLCDNFVGCLLHALAVRTKPIKDVPTPEGLSGIPLFKADLLSVWIYRRMSVGPIATALYNSANLAIDDLKVVIRACLEKEYTVKNRNLGDAILLLEHGGRDLDNHDPQAFTSFFAMIKTLLDTHPRTASERRKFGDRVVPSLVDRYKMLEEKRKSGWRISPYGVDNTSSQSQQQPQQQQEYEQEGVLPPPPPPTKGEHGDVQTISHKDLRRESVTSDDADSIMPRTPMMYAQQDLAEHITADEEVLHMHDTSLDISCDGAQPMPASPWNAYFAPTKGKTPAVQPVAATNSTKAQQMEKTSSLLGHDSLQIPLASAGTPTVSRRGSLKSKGKGKSKPSPGGSDKRGPEAAAETFTRARHEDGAPVSHERARAKSDVGNGVGGGNDAAAAHQSESESERLERRLDEKMRTFTEQMQAQMEIMARHLPKDLPPAFQYHRPTKSQMQMRATHPSHSEALAWDTAAGMSHKSHGATVSLTPSATTAKSADGYPMMSSPPPSSFRKRAQSATSNRCSGDSAFVKSKQESHSPTYVLMNEARRASDANFVVAVNPATPSESGRTERTYPATFRGNATLIQLDVPKPYGLGIEFSSNFRIGEAQSVARVFARVLELEGGGGSSPYEDDDEDNDADSDAIHFTSAGSVVQEFTLTKDREAKRIVVEYAPDMTLAHARFIGRKLASSVYQISS